MTGGLNATGATASGPLPPAFSQRPIAAPEPAAGDERPYPPFFPGEERQTAPAFGAPAQVEVPAPVAPAPPEAVRRAPAAPPPPAAAVLESQHSIPRQVPSSGPTGSGGFGGLPDEAIFLPDAAIPRRAPQPEPDREVTDRTPADLHDPQRRPVSTTDLAVLVAARLELFARRLRERGSNGLAESFSGDPLDLALAGLISGYIAGRRGS